MSLWNRLFGQKSPDHETSDSRENKDQKVSSDRGLSISLTTDLRGAQQIAGSLLTVEYDGGPVELFYERMSRELVEQHGLLVDVDYLSHFPDFEIYFHYQDGTRVYSGRRTGHYDIHFLSLGYFGEGPRYARHFLSAAGLELTPDEIETIKPGDSIKYSKGGAVIVRKDERVVLEEDSEVEFSHERQEEVFGAPAIYRHYTAPSIAVATEFLEKQDITAQSFFVVVETPEGTIAKDRMGIYEP